MRKTSPLAEFIDAERVAIVAEWEEFARTLLPAAGPMSPSALRDHADEILTAIVHDLQSGQSEVEQAEKSKGRGDARRLGAMGQIHAALRIEFGFNLGQMVSEYRALRASVMRMWNERGTDPEGVTRFNEAIDEALTEAVERFTETTQHYRDQSLGILSHDLRNPLGAIMMGANLLITAPELGDRSVSIAARMLSSASRMNRMIADLLDLTRTRFGDPIPVLRTAIDLEPLCKQVVAELEGLRSAGALVFNARGNLKGEWDSDRVAQVLSNLVRNAIQHGGSGEPITITADGTGDEVLLTIHNTGAPIKPSGLSSVFEPMIRHAADPQLNPGLGLGLYIASQIVIAHGGTIEVRSTDADGTTFTVRMPRRAHTAPDPADDGSRPGVPPPEAALAPAHA